MNIKTIILAAMLTVAGVLGARAQRLTAAWAFTMVPTQIMPSVAPDVRLDMVDYANSGSDKMSANELDGRCRIDKLTDTRLVARLSDVSTWELDLLPYRGDTIYMVLHTLQTPEPDTRVSFYDRSWSPLSAQLFAEPQVADYLKPKLSREEREDVANAIPFVLQQIEYDPVERTLTATPVFDRYVPDDEYARVSGYLDGPVRYKYNGKTFKRVR